MYPLYVVSAFSADWRSGNPAAICLLDEWLPNGELQAIAAQNNLSETAFLLWQGHLSELPDDLELRWFTPVAEVDLCGHATLATAHVLYRHLGVDPEATLRFRTRSGPLKAWLIRDQVAVVLPADVAVPTHNTVDWCDVLNTQTMPLAVFEGVDYVVIFADESTVHEIRPNMSAVGQLDRRGVIVSAQLLDSKDIDFVSRFFAPKLGVDEDPVTGSAHCQLIPYWSEVLGKRTLTGWQASPRGGKVVGEWVGSEVILRGDAVTYSQGQIIGPIGE